MKKINIDKAYEFVLEDLKNFKLLPDEFKNNKKFIKKCLRLNSFFVNLKYISEDLKSDPIFVKELIEIKPLSLFYMNKEFQESKDYMLIAATKDMFVIELADGKFKDYENNLDKLREEVAIEKFQKKLEKSLDVKEKKIKLKKI